MSPSASRKCCVGEGRLYCCANFPSTAPSSRLSGSSCANITTCNKPCLASRPRGIGISPPHVAASLCPRLDEAAHDLGSHSWKLSHVERRWQVLLGPAEYCHWFCPCDNLHVGEALDHGEATLLGDPFLERVHRHSRHRLSDHGGQVGQDQPKAAHDSLQSRGGALNFA